MTELKEGTKFDSERVQLQLLPPAALAEIAAVLTFGARKYAEWNWAKGIKSGRLVRAALGHIWAWWAGEDNDSETGLSHLAHAGCCILFLLDQNLSARAKAYDDRPAGMMAPPRKDYRHEKVQLLSDGVLKTPGRNRKSI